MLEQSMRAGVNEKRAADRERFLEVYRLVADGSLSTDDAIALLGYKSFKGMDRRRAEIGLPPLYDIGHGLEHSIKEIPAEVIEASMRKIAEERYKGNDIREEEARRIGFSYFAQMDRRRDRLGIPSVRDFVYHAHPELYYKYQKQISKERYARKLAKNRERAARKRNCEE